MPTDDAALQKQFTYLHAALDLCLDMERNFSDSAFAKQDGCEIVYCFDEDVFELFIGGHDEGGPEREGSRKIYHDRRRSIGIFNTRDWNPREKGGGSTQPERQRAEMNRQSAMLTSEWLFSGQLPGLRNETIYISRPHLGELNSRWERLVHFYRNEFGRRPDALAEQKLMDALLSDLSAKCLSSESPSSLSQTEINNYVDQLDEPLREDVRNLLQAKHSSEEAKEQALWQFVFSRKLASALAAMRVSEPLAQLIRINVDIARRLKPLNEHPGLDVLEDYPASERSGFWRKRLSDMDGRRKTSYNAEPRDKTSIHNDAYTLALVQAYANSAVRNETKTRFVFVTSDDLLIDAYREWHCYEAKNTEPFVLRSVRHFAPLLNLANMSSKDSLHASEWPNKQEVFPRLRALIEPFLLSVNLRSLPEGNHGDEALWQREQFSNLMKRGLSRFSDPKHADDQRAKEVWARLSEMYFFQSNPLERLAEIQGELKELAHAGRQMERYAVGFAYDWFDRRLVRRKPIQELQKIILSGDESALAKHMQTIADMLADKQLDLHLKLLDIDSELTRNMDASRGRRHGFPRVPLALRLEFKLNELPLSIAEQAVQMVSWARDVPSDQRDPPPGYLELRDRDRSDILADGGFRLFALYSCIALHLSHWELAFRCASESLERFRLFGHGREETKAELSYLVAVCIRFLFGAAAIRNSTSDSTARSEYDRAERLLQANTDEGDIVGTFQRLRGTSESLSLSLFGCGAALFCSDDQNFATAGFRPERLSCLLLRAFELSDIAFEGLRSIDTGSLKSEFLYSEIEDQVATNIAAAFCLLHAAKLRRDLDDERPFLKHLGNEKMEWIDHFADECIAMRKTCSPISLFYFLWYSHFRKTRLLTPGQLPESDWDLKLDREIAAGFRAILLQQGESAGGK